MTVMHTHQGKFGNAEGQKDKENTSVFQQTCCLKTTIYYIFIYTNFIFLCNYFIIISYQLIQFSILWFVFFFFSYYITALAVIYFHPKTQWVAIRTILIANQSKGLLVVSSISSLIWACSWVCHQVILAGQSHLFGGSQLSYTWSLILQEVSLDLYL